MKLYVIVLEYGPIIGVYSAKVKAESYLKLLDDNCYYIEEIVLDGYPRYLDK